MCVTQHAGHTHSHTHTHTQMKCFRTKIKEKETDSSSSEAFCVWWVITVIIKWLISNRNILLFLFLSLTSFPLQVYIILIALLSFTLALHLSLFLFFCPFFFLYWHQLSSFISLNFPFQQLSVSKCLINSLNCLLIICFFSSHVGVSLRFSSSAAVHNVFPGQVLSPRANENQGRTHQVKIYQTIDGLWVMEEVFQLVE